MLIDLFVVIFREHMDCHLDNVQSELDNIRDLLLRGDGYSIDANTLLGVSY